MLKEFLRKNCGIFIIEILTVAAFCLFYGRFGDIFVDSFREAYIPQQILAGKVLYKNIFCVYPPLSYMLNASFFKLFGVNLNVLYIAGLLSTMGIFYLTYRISELFFDKTQSFGINLFLFSALVLSPNVFNSFFPYSYGILYGLLFILLSIYFCLKKNFNFAYLFYSLAICCKYEFSPFLFCIIYFQFQTNSIKSKNEFFKNLVWLITPMAFVLIGIYCMGAGINDIKTAISIIIQISSTSTIKEFYSSMGLIFRWELLPLYGAGIVKFLIPPLMLVSKIFQDVLIYSFPLILTVAILRYKSLTKEERFIILLSLVISLKVFFALTLQSYGVFFVFFALISIVILTPFKYRKLLTVLLILSGLIIGYMQTQYLLAKKIEIKTDNGIIKVSERYKQLNDVILYINKLPKDSKVAVFPECLAVNFLTGRSSDNKFYSLIPLYVETFGEEIIIKRLEKFPPDCIILNNYDMSAYGYKEFGVNYGVNVYNWVLKNYYKDYSSDGSVRFRIYRK